MPADFLMEQMEMRENLEEARDISTLGSLQKSLSEKKKHLEIQIAEHIDIRRDYPSASDPVRKLMFLEKFGEEIDAVYETLES